MTYPVVSTTSNGDASAAFIAAAQKAGINVGGLQAVAQVQLALANLFAESPPGQVATWDDITLVGGTVTTSTPVLTATQTWNAGGVTFEGILFTVTDTASAAGSLVLNLKVGSSSIFSVRKDGLVAAANAAIATGTITTSQPLTLTQTWNAGGVTFESILVTVTDTASAAGSLLLNLKVGSTSMFSVSKAGAVTGVTLVASTSISAPATGSSFSSAFGGGASLTLRNTSTNAGALMSLAFGNDDSSAAARITIYATTHSTRPSYLDIINTANAPVVVGTNNAEIFRLTAATMTMAASTTLVGPDIRTSAAAATVAAGQIGWGATTQTTVGAAGGASALPATPTGYVIINVAGTNRVIPFYAAA